MQGGGIYLNNQRIAEDSKKVTLTDAIHGKFIVLRKGGEELFPRENPIDCFTPTVFSLVKV